MLLVECTLVLDLFEEFFHGLREKIFFFFMVLERKSVSA